MPFGDTHGTDINTAGDIKLCCAEHDLCRATADINNQMTNWIKYEVGDASLICQAALILATQQFWLNTNGLLHTKKKIFAIAGITTGT